MPIKKQAFKALRQSKKRHEKNKGVITEIKTLVKKASQLISGKKHSEADAALKELESKMYRAAKSNVIKKETASRKVSRMRIQWAKISAEPKKK
jgi:small subunit ribosomal protein S20